MVQPNPCKNFQAIPETVFTIWGMQIRPSESKISTNKFGDSRNQLNDIILTNNKFRGPRQKVKKKHQIKHVLRAKPSLLKSQED